MTASVVLPALLGVSFLVAGLITSRRERGAATSRDAFGLAVLGPTFIAAALAAFAGEHFTITGNIAQLVPKWLPGRLFIAYFVGVAHLAAALSFVARRYVRWSSIGLALMFALFVLLMDFPSAVTNPGNRLAWILTAREGTFAMGALALFAIETRSLAPQRAKALVTITRIWTAGVLVFYGIDQMLHPELSPGVPNTMPTAAWVPLPHVIAYATGILLIIFGVAMLVERFASVSAAWSGVLMVVLTLALYVPQFFLAHDASGRLVGINFVFDTLLFAGTVLVISRAIMDTEPRRAASWAARAEPVISEG